MVILFFSFLMGVPSIYAKSKIVIGSKDFSESFMLAEMMSQMIESHTDISVDRRHSLGGTKISFESLRTGEVDLYPEYTGTGGLVILKDANVATDRIEQLDQHFRKKFGIAWLEGFGFNNTYALVMRKKHAKKPHKVKKFINSFVDFTGFPLMNFG